jgi:hypothetical protein
MENLIGAGGHVKTRDEDGITAADRISSVYRKGKKVLDKTFRALEL